MHTFGAFFEPVNTLSLLHHSLAVALTVSVLPAFGQAPPPVHQLDSLLVTATPISGALARAGRHLQVLDSNRLSHAVRPEMSEVLRSNTLVDVRQRGPWDAQTDLGIRGGTYDQSLVLVDGIPMSDPQTGHHVMNVPVLGNAVQQVEVLYGGASRTFGGGAFSGAVNLVTREPGSTAGSLTAEGGSFGSWQVRASQEIATVKGGFRIAAFHGRTDGHVPNSDQLLQGGDLGYVHKWDRIKLKAHLGVVDKRFGAQNYYTSVYPDQYEETGTLMGSVQVSNAKAPWVWNARLYGRVNRDEFQLFRESDGYYQYDNGYFIRNEADTAGFGGPYYYTYHNHHRTDVGGAMADVKRTWAGGTTALGVHGRQERIISNVLGEPLPEPEPVPGSRDEYTKRTDRRNVAAHLEHRYEHGRFGVDAGILLNVNSDFTPQYAPGIDVRYSWSAKHTTYGNVNRSFRLPTWTDLYYDRGGAQGSIDLQPEHALQYELGHRIRAGAWRFSVALWRREGTDLIDWVQEPGSTVTRAMNITEVDMNGVECEMAWQARDGRSDLGLLYAYQWTDQTSFPYRSLYVLDQLRHNLVVWAQHRFGHGILVRTDLGWRERYGTYDRATDSAATVYPSPLRIDMRVEKAFRRVTLFASGYNLLDAEQMDRGNVPLPGRWLGGGATLTW